MGRVPWEAALFADLCTEKAAGRSFAAGWQLALMRNPPRSNIEKEIVGDVERFASDAWHGRKPALRSFSLEMLREGDQARQARSSGAWTVETSVAA